MTLIHLPHRCVASIEGPDRFTFLQGLVTCDVLKLESGGSNYAAFLTPQGKFLDDLFLIAAPDALLIDSYKATSVDLYKKLTMYKLRSQVTLTPLPNAHIYALLGEKKALPGLMYRDTRHAEMGHRLIANEPHLPDTSASLDFYDQHRYVLGIPDGARDMPIGKAVLLEYGFDEMGAIDWEKGCYLGQELTARTKYRGVIRKRLLPFTYEGTTPDIEASLLYEGQEAGEIRAAAAGTGLALVRLEYVDKIQKDIGKLMCGVTEIKPFVPNWMRVDLDAATL